MTAARAELEALLDSFDKNAHRGGDISLDPIRQILARLGHPQDNFPPVIHIAGTNGKGSTAAFVRSIAEAAGLKTHVSTSPHLVRINERVRLAGSLIQDEYFLECCKRAAMAAKGIQTSYFELTFAAAAIAFAEMSADLLVLEVGLGGLLDATNIIDDPAVSMITPIGLDHQAILGTTIAQIAWKKAGIIKHGRPVVSAVQTADAAGVISEEAFAKSAPLHIVSPEDVAAIDGPVGLLGAHQRENAALAIKALQVWGHSAIDVPPIRNGLAAVSWPARMQKLGSGPLTDQFPGLDLWLDGGHNPHGARALAKIVQDMPGRTALVMSMLEGKDARGFLEALKPATTDLFTMPIPSTYNGFDPEALAELGASLEFRSAASTSLQSALTFALEANFDRALICGSLYTAGLVLDQNDEAPI
ncbi:MAG: folylpolyglutamate synthase/dihydrofolate synthase family protein [Pseudomonadota bacterium]